MCWKLRAIFETHGHIEFKTSSLVLYLFVKLLPLHTHIPVPIPKLDFKIPEGRTYPPFNFPVEPKIVARKICSAPHF